MQHYRRSCAVAAGLVSFLLAGVLARGQADAEAAFPSDQWLWLKGNLHTHSLWSDGDDYPEMIADWYKRHGYHFLGISDHNVVQVGTRWLELKTPVSVGGNVNQRGGGPVLEEYRNRFGSDWVEQREVKGKREVRLKPLDEYRSLFEEPGRFLMIPSSEITSAWKRAKTPSAPANGGQVHINVTNVHDLIPPVSADNALEIIQRTVDAVFEQRARTGQAMFPHINHPNFGWGVTAEELMRVRHEQFFEVYNGHQWVNNGGDAAHLDTDTMWDVVLTFRLAELHLGVMYGMAVDDAHNYHDITIGRSNPGRGWVMVRARHLTAESIVRAMEEGDFYATSGVTLAAIDRESNQFAIEIQAEPGVTYVTHFIGTRRGFDSASEEVVGNVAEQKSGRGLAHRRYSKDIGAVLAEVRGTRAAYALKGDELYVRAKIVSSKPKVNGSVAGEFETAWTQPLVNQSK